MCNPGKILRKEYLEPMRLSASALAIACACPRHWLGSALSAKIKTVDWPSAAQDVSPFLPVREQASLTLWNERFFADKVARLVQAASVDA